MPKRPRAYIAAVPLSALPEVQALLARFCGTETTRDNVVMMRLSDASVAGVDTLVEAGVFGSRSEAAAFLVGAGIEAQRDLFQRIGKHSAEIKRLRAALTREALDALAQSAPKSRRKRPDG